MSKLYVASPERGIVSFQITILKILAGHPGGRASLDEVKRAVSLLMTSGADWTNRMKRLASLAPGLDMFSRGFVQRDAAGWHITDAGRDFLTLLEKAKVPVLTAPQATQVAEVAALPAPTTVRLIGTETRRGRRLHVVSRNGRLVA